MAVARRVYSVSLTTVRVALKSPVAPTQDGRKSLAVTAQVGLGFDVRVQ
jgi:hypothetical protein